VSIRFQADADINFEIVKAVRRRETAIDFASAADAGFESVGEVEILERAAKDHRALVSHDRRTMLNHFRQRLAAGKSSPGLLIVSQRVVTGLVVEAILLLWALAEPADLRDQAYHLPSFGRHVFNC
jgi:hypothetical protein